MRTLADVQDGDVPPAALIDDGFDDFENGPFIESFARHFMLALDDWAQGGPDAAMVSWKRYGEGAMGGDLAQLQRAPTWLDDGEVGQ